MWVFLPRCRSFCRSTNCNTKPLGYRCLPIKSTSLLRLFLHMCGHGAIIEYQGGGPVPRRPSRDQPSVINLRERTFTKYSHRTNNRWAWTTFSCYSEILVAARPGNCFHVHLVQSGCQRVWITCGKDGPSSRLTFDICVFTIRTLLEIVSYLYMLSMYVKRMHGVSGDALLCLGTKRWRCEVPAQFKF